MAYKFFCLFRIYHLGLAVKRFLKLGVCDACISCADNERNTIINYERQCLCDALGRTSDRLRRQLDGSARNVEFQHIAIASIFAQMFFSSLK